MLSPWWAHTTATFDHCIALQHGTSASGYMPQGDRFLPNTKKKIQIGGTSKDEMALVKRE